MKNNYKDHFKKSIKLAQKVYKSLKSKYDLNFWREQISDSDNELEIRWRDVWNHIVSKCIRGEVKDGWFGYSFV